jgi:hypothetical protein
MFEQFFNQLYREFSVLFWEEDLIWPLLITVLIVLAVASVDLFYLWKRRKQASTSAPTPADRGS